MVVVDGFWGPRGCEREKACAGVGKQYDQDFADVRVDVLR